MFLKIKQGCIKLCVLGGGSIQELILNKGMKKKVKKVKDFLKIQKGKIFYIW